MSALFSPVTLRGVTLAQSHRRVADVPVFRRARRSQRVAHDPSRAASRSRAPACCASRRPRSNRTAASRPAIWACGTTPPKPRSKPVLAAIRKHSKIAVTMQLAHAGRKASSHVPWDGGQLIPVSEGGWLPHAPSALPHKAGEARAARARCRRPEPRARSVRRVGEARGAARHRRARSAWRARLSAASVPLADRQPAHRRIRRLAAKTACAFRSKSSMRARGVSGRQAGRRARVGDGLGRRRLGLSRTRIAFAQELKKRGCRLDRCVVGRRLAAAENSARARLPGAVREGGEAGDRPARRSPSA